MLPDKLYANILAYQMLHQDDLVVVGVSGGCDSVGLLHALSKIAPKLNASLHVAHLDHQLRSTSADDAVFVRELAKSLGWQCTTLRCDVRGLAKRERLTIEEAGRLARYRFFAQVVSRIGAAGVVVGHTALDQVETVVMHWLRGSGTSGIRGLRPITVLSLRDSSSNDKRSLRVLRPLLDVTREQVRDYCVSEGLRVLDDESNRDLAFARNKVRWQLLPELRSWNPGFDRAVIRASRIAANDDDFLEEQVRKEYSRVVSEGDQVLLYNLDEWHSLPASLQYRLLRAGVAKLQGDLFELSMAHLDAAIEVIRRNRAGAVVHLPRGLRLVRRYRDFQLCRKGVASDDKVALSENCERLLVPGETGVAGGAIRVQATIVDNKDLPPVPAGAWRALLDASALGFGACVRRRRPGDRFQPMGMQQEKKLQDFFVDAKVVRFERDSVPLVVGMDGRIAWIVGWRVAEWAAVRTATRQVLDLTLHRPSSIQ